MNEEPSFFAWLLSFIGVLLLYYMGTRGIVVLTRRYAGRWYRRALVSLSFALLFAPSFAGVGHAGVLPVPAWAAALQYAGEGLWQGFAMMGVVPIVVTWAVFFGLASIEAVMSKNKNNKADNHGKET